MKILIRQFLGKNHSWSVCGWGIATALKQMDHHVDLFSTDGIEHLPHSLKENVIGYIENNTNKIIGSAATEKYDCQISYTSMKNFPHYLSSGSKNRFGIWCYEWAGENVLPTGFAKNYKFCDYLCAPSNFAKKVFLQSKIPEDVVKVIPHGINAENFRKTTKVKLNTNKKFKILCNIAQNHIRKNIPGILEAYGRAFSKNDDVCLIIKGKETPVKLPFDISLNQCLIQFKSKYKNHAEIKLFNEFVDDISDLYRSVDATFSLSFCEGFLFPALESIAAGKLVIAPNSGGQIDFLNSSNALLVNGKETRANPKSMYWESKPNAIWFEPSIDDAVNKLKYAYNNFSEINKEVEKQKEDVLDRYSWNNITKQFLSLCK